MMPCVEALRTSRRPVHRSAGKIPFGNPRPRASFLTIRRIMAAYTKASALAHGLS